MSRDQDQPPAPRDPGHPPPPDSQHPRERQIIDALVAAAQALATGRDEVALLHDVTTACARLLDVESAGLLLADRGGRLQLMAASSRDMRQLELFQVQQEHGPCVDCYRTGRAVTVSDLAAAGDRWPEFVATAAVLGFHSVHAVPLRLRERNLGALGLFGTRTGTLNDADLGVAQALADVASVALVQSHAAVNTGETVAHLQAALDSRIVLEQAKGVLAQYGELDMQGAFTVLRLWSRDHNERIHDVARRVVDRTIPAAQMLEHARRRNQVRGGSASPWAEADARQE